MFLWLFEELALGGPDCPDHPLRRLDLGRRRADAHDRHPPLRGLLGRSPSPSSPRVGARQGSARPTSSFCPLPRRDGALQLRPGWTWLAMTGMYALTLVLANATDVNGLPALPFVSAGFLLANGDLIWRRLRPRKPSSFHRRRQPSRSNSDDRTRRAACAGTCPPASRASGRSRTPRVAPSRSPARVVGLHET